MVKISFLKYDDDDDEFLTSSAYFDYSVSNKSSWVHWDNVSEPIQIENGDILYLRGNESNVSEIGIGGLQRAYFSVEGTVECQGNISSLILGDAFLNQTNVESYSFASLFYNCTGLTSAENLSLPATTLANRCYASMFSNCTSLTTAPELPATTLANRCYASMFSNCTSLTTTPELPATTLADECYNSMFYGTNVLPDTSNIDFTSEQVVASGGLIGLFDGTNVTDNDLMRILPKNGNGKYCLPATTLANNCYYAMFAGCTSLTTAPELPATTLASYCYQSMFYGCTSLTTAPELPATTLANHCYGDMFFDCTSLTTAPQLPATTLASSCYQNMFYGCTSLSYIKAMFTTTPSDTYTYKWVDGVASSGTFVKNSAATWTTTGVNGIPTGWTVQTATA